MPESGSPTMRDFSTGYASGGFVQETGIAKVHRGETITPAGGSGDITINMNNYGSNAEVSEVEQYMISDKRIIDISIKAAGSNGPYRRAHKVKS